jgi:hypothetical protein
MARTGLAGPAGSLTTGMSFGVPPIIKYGNKQLQERFLPELLTGKKRTCIAITEPEAGSDVANITTTATKTPDGKHYIVNGTKKWITNGIWAEYSSMAVRTGGPGPTGLSMLVVPLKGYPGVNMRRLKVGGQVSAGTTFIELDDVKVPVENLIGEEGMGMKYMYASHVLDIAVQANRYQHDELQPRTTLHRHWCDPPSPRRAQRSHGICPQARSVRKASHRPARRPTPTREGWSSSGKSVGMGRAICLPNDKAAQGNGRH